MRIQMMHDVAATRRLAKSINVKKWTPAKTKRRTEVRRSPVSKAAKA